jgi:hypothetical protein
MGVDGSRSFELIWQAMMLDAPLSPEGLAEVNAAFLRAGLSELPSTSRSLAFRRAVGKPRRHTDR